MHSSRISIVFVLLHVACMTGTIITNDPLDECSSRFEFRHEMPEIFPNLKNCTYVRQMKPICGKEFVVAYSEHPPYSHETTSGNATGLIPGMLRFALETCCYHCANLKFVGPFLNVEKYFYENASIVLPVESSRTSKKFLGYDYVHFLEVHGVTLFAKEMEGRAEKLTKHMFKSIMATWPLFIVAFLMAIIAGLVMWVLDTWFNRDEFPSSFPRGPFEGFWWAFVSMTTVGYGDRAPKSVIARLFAVMWILLGITIFSMYTATLTSALTENVASIMKESILNKKVGVLNATAAGTAAAVLDNAIPTHCRNVEECIEKLQKDEIFAIALDDNIANYYNKKIKEAIPSIHRYQHIELDYNSYGILSYDKSLTKFLRTFFESNEDNRITMMSHVKNHHWTAQDDVNEVPNTTFFASNSPVFHWTLGALVILGILTAAIGLSCKWFFNRHKDILDRWMCIQNCNQRKNKEKQDIELKPMMSHPQEDFFQELEELKVRYVKKMEQQKATNGNA